MERIDIAITLAAPLPEVFAALTDHENYDRYPGIRSSALVQEGSPERNGLGAVRRIGLKGGPVLFEKIVRYEHNRAFDYKIIRATPFGPKHRLGSVEVSPDGDGTHVRWWSEFSVPIPIVGSLVTRKVAKQMDAGFRAVLRAVEKRVTEELKTAA